MLKYAAAAPIVLGLGMAAEVLVGPARAPADPALSASAVAPGHPVNIISRAGWGADESIRRGIPRCGNGIRAGIVHHSATGNGYAPTDSAAIVRSIYECHTLTHGWGDIGYNALVDKYGQIFEGRFGGITKPVEGIHTGGFNTDTWAVCMIGDLSQAPPTPEQLRAVGQLLGWRLAMDTVNPNGTVVLTSAGGPNTRFPQGATPTLPSIFAHRDVGDTACPGNAGYAFMERIRDIAARFKQVPNAQDLAESMQGGAIYARWQAMGGMTGRLGAPTSPEAPSGDSIRYVVFANGAIYWSPATGAQPLTGRIYEAWATLRYERGELGLPTSAEIEEPEWIVQNFQHGTLNFNRRTSTVMTVIDGVASVVPPPPVGGPPVQLERFSAARNPVV
nr:N-acetylmuramoyl-L-alanine amidase [Mycobacterium numidiamassiliense]